MIIGNKWKDLKVVSGTLKSKNQTDTYYGYYCIDNVNTANGAEETAGSSDAKKIVHKGEDKAAAVISLYNRMNIVRTKTTKDTVTGEVTENTETTQESAYLHFILNANDRSIPKLKLQSPTLDKDISTFNEDIRECLRSLGYFENNKNIPKFILSDFEGSRAKISVYPGDYDFTLGIFCNETNNKNGELIPIVEFEWKTEKEEDVNKFIDEAKDLCKDWNYIEDVKLNEIKDSNNTGYYKKILAKAGNCEDFVAKLSLAEIQKKNESDPYENGLDYNEELKQEIEDGKYKGRWEPYSASTGEKVQMIQLVALKGKYQGEEYLAIFDLMYIQDEERVYYARRSKFYKADELAGEYFSINTNNPKFFTDEDIAKGKQDIIENIVTTVIDKNETRENVLFIDVLTNTGEYLNVGNINDEDAKRVEEMASLILTVVTNIAMVTAVLMVAIIGIKYMLGSVEEKAEYKKDMIPYLVGAILVFGITAIVRALIAWGQNINNI